MFRALASPRMLGLHLVAVVATVSAVLLGLWQYHAWQINREDQSLALVKAAPRPLQSVMSGDDPFPGDAVGRPVQFAGRWLGADTILVSGRALHGRTGFWVVTPVEVCRSAQAGCAGGSAMLVVRGWTPQPGQAPRAPAGKVEVTGWLQPAEESGVTDPDPADDVLPELRIAAAIQHVDQDLYGGFVIAKDVSTGTGTLEPVTPESLPRPDTFTSLRNLLYALEWWVFGGFAVFLWARWCFDEVRRTTGRASGTTAADRTRDPEVASSP